MQIIILIIVMAVIGVVIGVLAGAIWRGNRPLGIGGDILIAVISAVAIGLIDWFVIPAMGFSETIKWLGVAIEPPLGALLFLWLVRLARR